MEMSYRMCTGFIVAGAAVGLAMGCGSSTTEGGAEMQAAAVVQGTTTVLTGTTSDAAGTSQYKIEVPSPWNGTLVLYSHGYSFGPSPATDAPGAEVTSWLLDHGYAVAGSSYSTSGWAVQQAFQDQMAVLDVFDKSQFGHPKRTIAWGHSLGGLITAGLVQLFPERFTAALPMCGVVAGAPASWNDGFDGEFVLSTLVAPFKLVNFTAADVGTLAAPGPEFKKAQGVLGVAQMSPEGRARIALAAAVGNL
ncbi:MAG TPA: prolyl oligopeptidase family serine peptidase, partial [Polyangiaceae bacterium]|nr:prolyl oligopeptidase family serine peptidase [Polyangiaceae bacterium]